MSDDKRTPGPWQQTGKQVETRLKQVCETYGAIRNGVRDDTEALANAAFIVRACNAHDELVEALNDAADVIERHAANQRRHDCPGFDCSICTVNYDVEKARAALRRSEGNA